MLSILNTTLNKDYYILFYTRPNFEIDYSDGLV